MMNKYTKFKLVGDLETTITGKLLYLVLLDITDEENKIVIPQKRISKALGISKTTVSRNMRRLAGIGAVRINPTFHDDGGRAANRYTVLEG
jgi:DNA-binding MarR family transcriptional regulator